MPNTGPRDGWRSVVQTFRPTFAIAWLRPRVVTVLPSPSGVGGNGGDHDELAQRLVGQPVEDGQVDLRLVASIELELIILHAQVLGDLLHGEHLGLLGNFDVGKHGFPSLHAPARGQCE